MKCDEIREMMLDVAAGATEATPVVHEHLLGCPDCAGKLAGMRQTMALLDEWQAPDPSSYFDTRLAARMREERAKPERAGWLSWFRAPALAGALALVLMVAGGIGLYNKGRVRPNAGKTDLPIQIVPGTAVGDLQTLDEDEDLYADFDVLDDLQVQPDVDADQETP
jgi:predicted anti-sigma-YlaC factor YlaD